MESNVSRGVVSYGSTSLWTYMAQDDSPCSVLHKLLTSSAIVMLVRSPLGWLNAHVLSDWPLWGSTECTTHFCTCNIQFLCAVCWEPDTSRQGRFTEHVRAVCTAHAEQIWHFLEALGWYQIDMYVSAPGTQKYSALKGFCSAWRDFRCFPTQLNSTARLNPLERVKHPGIAGWYLW